MVKKTFTISILLVVLAALSIFISCKTQPTAVSDFQVIEEIPNTTPTPTDTNGSTNINITIDNSKGLSQFSVSYYKSGNYYVNGNVAYYYVTVSNNCIIVGAKYTNGTVLEENANMYLTDSSQTGASYSLKGTRFSQQNVNTATATFTEDGYLIIKFSNVSSEIRYSLQSKSEETYNGELIPEVFWGKYVIGNSSSVNYGNCALPLPSYWEVRADAISFNGGEAFPIKSLSFHSENISFHRENIKNTWIATTDFTNGGTMYYEFDTNSTRSGIWQVRTTNSLGNDSYYLTYGVRQ